MKKIIYLLTVLTINICCSLDAVDAQEYLSKYIDISDGLPSNKVYRVSQTKDGFYWFCTEEGLVRYDGESMRVFGTKDGLPSADVYKVYEDKIGRLWVLSVSNKLAYIKNGEVTVIDAGSSLKLADFWEDSNGVYFGSAYESFHINYTDEVRDYCNDILEDSIFYSSGILKTIIVDRGDTFWLDQKFDRDLVYKYYFETYMSDSFLTSSRNSYNDRYIAHTIDGNYLYFFDNKTSNATRIDVGFPYEYVRRVVITPSREGGFYVNAVDVFLKIDSTLQIVDSTQISDFGITQMNSIFVDDRENIWVSSEEGIQVIIKKTQGSKVLDQCKDADVRGITLTDGWLVVHTANELFINDMAQEFNLKKAISEDLGGIYCIIKSNNDMYVSSRNRGVEKWSIKNHSISIGAKVVPFENCDTTKFNVGTNFMSKFILEDEHWILGISPSISFWKKDLSRYCRKNETGHFYDLKYVEKDTAFWFCSRNKTFRLKSNSRNEEEIKLPIEVKSIHPLDSIVILNSFDSKLGLWTKEGGYKEVTEVEIELVSALQLGPDIYLITQNAIYSLSGDYSEIEALFDFTFLGSDVQINDAEIVDSIIYFVTTKGIVQYAIDTDMSAAKEVNIALTSHDTASKYSYDYVNNSLTFSYTPIYLGAHEQLTYEYRLIPSQSTFVASPFKQVVFSGLQSNDYRFEVRAIDIAGKKGPVKSVEFKIRTPWFKSVLFYVLCVLSLLILIAFVWAFYLNRIKKKTALEQKFAELELNALQSQMNPHFIFNALNSIQNLIGRNESEMADAYVAKFAYVMRQFLEISRTKFIPLSREIDITKAYLDLEKLRFGDRLDYDVVLDVSEADLRMEVPATLIQPFVENAIIHGVFHKKGKGKIQVQIERVGSFVVVTIRDNGIGLKKAAEMKARRNREHISRGRELIDEKIEVIRKMTNLEISVETRDISNKNNTGTEVVIRINNREE